MSRPPQVESLPEGIIKQGRVVSSLLKDCQRAVRLNVELAKCAHASSNNDAEKKLLSDYLQDPDLNPAADEKPVTQVGAKVVTEWDRILAKLTRGLKGWSEEEVDRLLKIAKLQRQPVSV